MWDELIVLGAVQRFERVNVRQIVLHCPHAKNTEFHETYVYHLANRPVLIFFSDHVSSLFELVFHYLR